MKVLALVGLLIVGFGTVANAEEVFVDVPNGAFFILNTVGGCGGGTSGPPGHYYVVGPNVVSSGFPGGQTHGVVWISGLRSGDQVSFSVETGSKRCNGGYNPNCAGYLGAYWMADPATPEVAAASASIVLIEDYDGTACVKTGEIVSNGTTPDLMLTYGGSGWSSIYNATEMYYRFLTVTIPDHAALITADGVVRSDDHVWGTLKALYR